MNTILSGNLLEIPNGIICHQVNCRRVAGSGLAYQIRKRWSNWYTEYRNTEPKLGRVTYFRVNNELLIANLYAQDSYGKGRQHTDYDALRACLQQVNEYAKENSMQVFLPYGIGCGLAGGDWDRVKHIIADEVSDATIIKL